MCSHTSNPNSRALGVLLSAHLAQTTPTHPQTTSNSTVVLLTTAGALSCRSSTRRSLPSSSSFCGDDAPLLSASSFFSRSCLLWMAASSSLPMIQGKVRKEPSVSSRHLTRKRTQPRTSLWHHGGAVKAHPKLELQPKATCPGAAHSVPMHSRRQQAILTLCCRYRKQQHTLRNRGSRRGLRLAPRSPLWLPAQEAKLSTQPTHTHLTRFCSR